MTPAQKLRTLIVGNRALIAPAVFNPLSAKLAANAGFEVLYLGGGTLGYLNCCLEAKSYECLAKGVPDPLMAGTTHKDEQHALHDSIDMDRMLKVERETVEK